MQDRSWSGPRKTADAVSLAARTSEMSISRSAFCLKYLKTSVTNYRPGQGIMRAVFLHADEEAWAMCRSSADLSRELLHDKLSGYCPDIPPDELKRRILFAHEMFMGTMVHLTPDSGGPLALGDDRLRGRAGEYDGQPSGRCGA